MLPRLIVALLVSQPADLPLVTVDRDNVSIMQSCRIAIEREVIEDADANGVIHIDASDVTIEFVEDRNVLNGAPAATPWDQLTGIGIRIDRHKNVTIRGAKTHRFKVGIYATDADGLTLDACDVGHGFMQRLHSTKRAEDGRDWLWPHNNDNHEWMNNYGAGIYVERSQNVTIRNTIARERQNGVILDRVEHSTIYDNDCSFLSGWGLALWRSSQNTITRNAFDFCIRGYSHGVYNRGQDSAGILMFEQCCDNIIAENSVTHGGDGLFAFAGREALGEVNPREDLDWYKDRGNSRNIFARNDFSYAAAHGLELTFSSHNSIHDNRFVDNAICGIWGGYSRHTNISNNVFESNGEMAYGQERGGINIEHGVSNQISLNDFINNRCGVFLWWDDDAHFTETPWGKANDTRSADNRILSNTFTNNDVTIQLRRTVETHIFGLPESSIGSKIDVDDDSRPLFVFEGGNLGFGAPMIPNVLGESHPVNARADLRDREHIIMTEWGPYDWKRSLIHLIEDGSRFDTYELLGFHNNFNFDLVQMTGNVAVRSLPAENTLTVTPRAHGEMIPYTAKLQLRDETMHIQGVVADIEWNVSWFHTPDDPRNEPEAWNVALAQEQFPFTFHHLNLHYGMGAPGSLAVADVPELQTIPLAPDHFGMRATARIRFPEGRWLLRTTSDDGIRVRLDNEFVIDDWTWHAPKEISYEFEVSEPRAIDILVEHFELDGYAILDVDFEPIVDTD